MTILAPFVIVIFSYLLGSIPFGYVLTRLAGKGDIRAIGSGNIGATNVLRTGDKKLAALTLLLDGVKGALAVFLAGYLSPEDACLAAPAALLGHVFPVWLKFKGGKGVATFIGAMLALAWPVGLTIIIVWLLVARKSRYSSLAALVSIGTAPIDLFFFGDGDFFITVLLMAALVIWKHRGNIERLRDGTEPKIGKTADGTTPA